MMQTNGALSATKLFWLSFHLSLLSLSTCYSLVTTSLHCDLRHGAFTKPKLTRLKEAGDFFDEISETTGNYDDDDNQGETEGINLYRRMQQAKSQAGEWDQRIPKLNTVTLSGRVGNDPDARYFDDGKVVLNLSLAVKRKYHPLERKARNIKSGEEETDWFTLEIWGRDAEYAAKYIDKGTRLGVTGSLQVDEWTDRETGEPRERVKIIVKHMDVLESRAESELRREKRRGPAFYRKDETKDDDGGFNPAGTGGFFD